MNKLLLSTYLAITFLLSACGGSSGDDKPTPEPVPAPLISSFTASASSIMAGEATNLTAVFSNGNGTIDTSVGSINSGESKVVLPNNTTTYTLTVENSAGVKASSTITIKTIPLLITVIHPSSTNNSSVYGSVEFLVTVNSQLNIAEVTAEISEHSTVLDLYNNQDNSYSGKVLLTGLPSGEYPFTVTGRDKLGRINSVHGKLFIDYPPEINIITPIDQSFSTPLLPLDISCIDDSAECQITVKIQNTVFASSTNTLKETIDLSNFIGEKITLQIESKNKKQQVVTKTRDIYINGSDINITLIKTFSEKIIDFDGERALLYNDTPSSGKQLQIANTTNDDVTLIEFNNAHKVYSDKSILTSTGAIFSASTGSTYDWNNNELINLGQTTPVAVTADFAAYCNNNNLLLRSFSKQSNTVLGPDLSACYSVDVSENGTVVAEMGWNIVRYKNQEETLISSTLVDYVNNSASDASINGSLIAFYANDISRSSKLILYDDNEDKIIFTADDWVYRGAGYAGSAINNGWLAFSNEYNIFTRDISGNILQRTNLLESNYIFSHSANGEILSLTDNGELLFSHDGKRYLSKPNGDMVFINSVDNGTIIYRGSAWYIFIEKHLYKLNIL